MKLTRRRVRAIAVAVSAASAVAAPVSLAATHHHRHAAPNLTVSGGAVRLSDGRIIGSFTVRNAGAARAGRSRAALSMKVSGQRRQLGGFSVAALKPGAHAKIAVSLSPPAGMPAGTYAVRACADAAHAVSESSERDNCTKVGRLTFTSPATPAGSPAATTPTTPTAPSPTPTTTTPTTTAPTTTTPTTPTPTEAPTATEPQPGPAQVPTDLMTIPYDTPTLVQDSYDGMTGSYYVTTPPKYDVTGATPMRLLVWMHGCGGEALGDSYEMIVSNKLDQNGDLQENDSRDFIVISIGGRDLGCWNPDTDVVQVLMAIADVTTHFNIDRRHIFIAGYSSGGDLAYRTIFYNADEFAGLLAVNTNPFRDTGSTEAESLAAAAWKFHIAQVAHSGDEEYHLNPCSDCLDGGGNDPGVLPAMDDLTSAGYNVNLVIKPGNHYDQDNFKTGTGTDYDFRQYALPFIDNPAWESPGP